MVKFLPFHLFLSGHPRLTEGELSLNSVKLATRKALHSGLLLDHGGFLNETLLERGNVLLSFQHRQWLIQWLFYAHHPFPASCRSPHVPLRRVTYVSTSNGVMCSWYSTSPAATTDSSKPNFRPKKRGEQNEQQPHLSKPGSVTFCHTAATRGSFTVPQAASQRTNGAPACGASQPLIPLQRSSQRRKARPKRRKERNSPRCGTSNHRPNTTVTAGHIAPASYPRSPRPTCF